MPAVRRSPRLALLAALPLVLALVLAGLSACQDDEPAAPTAVPSAPSSPLESIETTGLAVARADFCERVAPAQAQDALGADARPRRPTPMASPRSCPRA
jgi:hypothetical protein